MHVHRRTFGFILLLSLHNYDAKLLNFTFLNDVVTRQRTWIKSLRILLQKRMINQHLTNLRWRNDSDEVGNSANQLLSDIFAAIGVVVGTRVGGLSSLAEFLYLKTGFMARAPSS